MLNLSNTTGWKIGSHEFRKIVDQTAGLYLISREYSPVGAGIVSTRMWLGLPLSRPALLNLHRRGEGILGE